MRIWAQWLALLTAAALMMALGASAASAAPTGSCKRDSATPSHYDCQFYTPGNGISAGSPVVDVHGSGIGYLNGGTNFVDCQSQGSEYPSASASVRNDWWAWTEANNHKWGWVSAYWASGGANDEKFSGVPSCPSSMGPAPIVGSAPTPSPTPPSTPRPVPCSPGGGHWYCNFWPSGNGISAGAPVTDDNGYWVGYVNQGRNFVDCQEYGGKVALGGNYNHYWAWTEANNHKWGWVSALFASGGDNDGKFQGVPSCDVQRDAPPTALKSTGPRKSTRPTKPKGNKPDPTRCSRTSYGTVHITFREYEQKYEASRPANSTSGYGPITNLEKPGHHTFATLSVSADTCKGPHGWHLGHTLSIAQTSVGLYPGADNSPTPRGSGGVKGMGIAVQSVRNGVLSVRGLACTTTEHVGWWTVVHKIVGLIPPIPNTPFAVSVGKYALGLIPTSGPSYTTHCGDLGFDRIHIGVTRHGDLRAWSHEVADQRMTGIVVNDGYTQGGVDVLRLYSRRPDPPIIK